VTSNDDPYCGTPPAPIDLWSAWNLDPPLLLVIAACTIFLYRRANSSRERMFTLLLAAIAIIAFVSPLCGLTSALFSARGVHHIIVVSILPPLLILSSRSAFAFWDRLCQIPPEGAFLFSTAVFWLWHMPFAYSYALSSSLAYWLMQIALLISNIALWAHLLNRRAAILAKLSLSTGTMIQMGFLSALLTFAPYPLYDEHLTSTLSYGLTPLSDQQLSGLIMWTIGLLPYGYLTLVSFAEVLRRNAELEE
jgi:putative membrane protein